MSDAAREIGKAVAIAALSAAAVKVLEWGVDELRIYVERRREERRPAQRPATGDAHEQ